MPSQQAGEAPEFTPKYSQRLSRLFQKHFAQVARFGKARPEGDLGNRQVRGSQQLFDLPDAHLVNEGRCIASGQGFDLAEELGAAHEESFGKFLHPEIFLFQVLQDAGAHFLQEGGFRAFGFSRRGRVRPAEVFLQAPALEQQLLQMGVQFLPTAPPGFRPHFDAAVQKLQQFPGERQSNAGSSPLWFQPPLISPKRGSSSSWLPRADLLGYSPLRGAGGGL